MTYKIISKKGIPEKEFYSYIGQSPQQSIIKFELLLNLNTETELFEIKYK